MHQIGDDEGTIREMELLKEVHDSEKQNGRKGESEALTEAAEREMNRRADEQKGGEWMRDRKLEKAERERERKQV